MLSTYAHKLILGLSHWVYPLKMIETIQFAIANGIRRIDCASINRGHQENTLGLALQPLKKDTPIEIATRAGSVINTDELNNVSKEFPTKFKQFYDYSGEGILKSFEQSKLKMGLNSFNKIVIHGLDPLTHGEHYNFHYRNFVDTGVSALEKLKKEHKIEKISYASKDIKSCEHFLLLGAFSLDEIIVDNTYNLLNQAALNKIIPVCRRYNFPLIVSSPYSSGLLGSLHDFNFFRSYKTDLETRTKLEKIEQICKKHGVSLQHAAMQFVYANPYVEGVIVNARNPEELKACIRDAIYPIAPDFWQDLVEHHLIPEACLAFGLTKTEIPYTPRLLIGC